MQFPWKEWILSSVIAQLFKNEINTTSLQSNNLTTFQIKDGLSLSSAIAQFTLEGINSVFVVRLHSLPWKRFI
jgi:hypothetical protein